MNFSVEGSEMDNRILFVIYNEARHFVIQRIGIQRETRWTKESNDRNLKIKNLYQKGE